MKHKGAFFVLVIIMVLLLIGREHYAVNPGRQITLHYTNWCPHCQRMKPIWAAVKSATAGSGIKFIENDEEAHPTPGISGYPTILMVDSRGRTSKYMGPPEFESLRNWVVSPSPHDF